MSEQSIPESLLSKVRALLAKAENPAATVEEAEAYTAKAAEMMAKYGIEQAMFAAHNPGADKPADRVVTTSNPWGMEKARLAYQLAEAMRCKALMLGRNDGAARVHLFGFASDLERVEVLYTSLLLQMTGGLAKTAVPYYESPRSFRRAWMVGFVVEVTRRVREAEQRAAARAQGPEAPGSRSTALVLADRAQIVQRALSDAYPRTTSRRTSVRSGTGYSQGTAAGSRANIGQSGLVGGRRAIGGAR